MQELQPRVAKSKNKKLSGCDTCGRELCCLTFLSQPIEVGPEILNKKKGRNKSKLIGVCGRPKCCLAFGENEL